MNRGPTALIAGALAASLGACGEAEGPVGVAVEVAKTRSAGDERLFKDEKDTALAEAESEHETARERCEALSGPDREARSK